MFRHVRSMAIAIASCTRFYCNGKSYLCEEAKRFAPSADSIWPKAGEHSQAFHSIRSDPNRSVLFCFVLFDRPILGDKSIA